MLKILALCKIYIFQITTKTQYFSVITKERIKHYKKKKKKGFCSLFWTNIDPAKDKSYFLLL